MLKESQQKYLDSLPDGKTIEVKPFDPRVREVAEEIMAELREDLPELPVHFGGAAALGLAGQNDIDILVLSTPPDFESYRGAMEKRYGAPSRIGKTSVKWEFNRGGFEVELYMTDKDSPGAKEQIRIFELLSGSKELRDEYERIKMPFGKIDFKDYMRKKYEFYNRALGENQ